MNLQRETFANTYQEALPLCEKQWQEMAWFRDFPLSVDEHKYRVMEEAGLLRVYTARHDGELIGYAVFTIALSSQFKGCKQAFQNTLYLDPDQRHGHVGLRLIDYVERELRSEGVNILYQDVYDNHRALGAILQRRGYGVMYSIYAKQLNGVNHGNH